MFILPQLYDGGGGGGGRGKAWHIILAIIQRNLTFQNNQTLKEHFCITTEKPGEGSLNNFFQNLISIILSINLSSVPNGNQEVTLNWAKGSLHMNVP